MQAGLRHRLLAMVLMLSVTLALGGTAGAQSFGNGLVAASTVGFLNRSSRTLYVSFAVQPGRIAQILWSPACERFNDQVRLGPGQSCSASIPSSVGPSRFCAAENPAPAGRGPNCNDAELQNQTVIQTNFTNGQGCRPMTQASCLWYNISIAAENCTNCDWNADNCKDTGGAAYNVPVQLSCRSGPTFTCRGPVAPLGVYGVNYPTNCGTPFNQPTCIGGPNGACQQAFFYPMSTSGACAYPASRPQPIGQCQQGEALVVTFLEGP